MLTNRVAVVYVRVAHVYYCCMNIVLQMRRSVPEAKFISYEGSAIVMTFGEIPVNAALEAKWAGYEMSLEDRLVVEEWQAECAAVAAGIAKERAIEETATRNERMAA